MCNKTCYIDKMDLCDKKEWLSRHGTVTGGGYDPAQGHHAMWQTQTGMEFKGVGQTIDDMKENLFRVVYETLYHTACNLKRRNTK